MVTSIEITVYDPSTRKSREGYWQRTLNTIFPDGLNNRPSLLCMEHLSILVAIGGWG